MARQLEEGQGSFSANKYKKLPKHPDITGRAMIHGQIVKIAGWIKENDWGKWYSIQIQDDVPRGDTAQQQAPRQNDEYAQSQSPDDGDIPFVWFLPLLIGLGTAACSVC